MTITRPGLVRTRPEPSRSLSLGLTKTFDLGWVKILSLSPTSSVGLVDGKSGAHRHAAEKPVMVSLVVATTRSWLLLVSHRHERVHCGRAPCG